MVGSEYIVNLQGKDFVLYTGLLDLATQMGLTSLTTKILQYPDAENGERCIVEATARFGDKIFIDVGDADPDNVGKKVAAHRIRMASTRAKARVLRDGTNVGITAFEELDLEQEVPMVAAPQKKSNTAWENLDPMSPITEAQAKSLNSAHTALRGFGLEIEALNPEMLQEQAKVLYDVCSKKYKELNAKVNKGIALTPEDLTF